MIANAFTTFRNASMTRRALTAALPALTLVLLLAALLRIVNITQQSLWFDEAFAWNIVIQEDMLPRIIADTHPPLYYLLLRGWIELAGDSPLALRYLSALIGMGTVAFVYQVGRELARGRPALASVPVLAALLVALSSAEIFLSQEARNYTLYTFFASLSMWWYLRWLRRGDRGAALVWVLSTAALLYTHYQGAFIPAIQVAHGAFFLRGRQRRAALGLLAICGLLFAPWFFGVTVAQARRAIDYSLPFSIPTNWETLLHLRDRYMGAMWPLLLPLALTGAGALAGQRWRSRPAAGRVFLVASWFLLPFCVLFFGNLFASLLTERKLLIIVPALSLLIAFGLGWLPASARRLLVAALLIYGLTTVDYYRVKEPWDRIAAAAVPYARPDDLALIEVGVGQYPLLYYWGRLLPEGVRISTFPVLGDTTLGQTDWYTYYDAWLPFIFDLQAEQVGDGVATAWLVFWSRERAAIERLEAAGYTRTMTITYDHLGNAIDLYRYDRLLPSDEPAVEFDNGMILRAVEIDAGALRVDLWWSADTPPDGDYTVSALLLDEHGALAAQYDSPPGRGQRSTRGWQPGEIIYDPRPLELTAAYEELPPGRYTVAAQVYRFTSDGTLVHALPVDAGDEQTYHVLGHIER
jgi:mannosyltransferase